MSRVCLGAFAGAHGVRGEAKIKTFTADARNIAAYGPVESEDGRRRFTLTFVREVKPGLVIVRAPEIESREDAMALAGVKLFIDREKLPPPDEDEYYMEDLVGLKAVTETGAPAGIVAAVLNFGAGELLELREIPGHKGAHLVPFTKEAAPDVDLKGGTVTVNEAFLPEDQAQH